MINSSIVKNINIPFKIILLLIQKKVVVEQENYPLLKDLIIKYE